MTIDSAPASFASFSSSPSAMPPYNRASRQRFFSDSVAAICTFAPRGNASRPTQRWTDLVKE